MTFIRIQHSPLQFPFVLASSDGDALLAVLPVIWIILIAIKDLIWLFESFWKRLFIVIFILVVGFLVAGAFAGIAAAIVGGRNPPPVMITFFGGIGFKLWHLVCKKVFFKSQFDD
ncbi:MAG: hypothetical protein JWL59_4884 [Chthoniobacteraceae bacterium]|nr:hypothetical protein [Chthoniobacteraceae bacterium]